MKKVLPDSINSDETGFLKGRSIRENVRLIDSIITYAESQNILGIFLFTYFEKGFDTLEWHFIQKTLRYYNFSDSMIIDLTSPKDISSSSSPRIWATSPSSGKHGAMGV